MRNTEHEHERDHPEALLSFASQLKKGRGLCVVAEIEEGVLSRDRGLSRRISDAREALEARLASADVRGFAHVLVAPEYKQGLPFAIQGLGFGGLEPNTVLLGWPRRNHADFDDDAEEDAEDARAEEAAETLVATVCECTAAEKAVLLCLDPHAFPGSDERVSGFVDVWWVVHDGGLLLMIAHLLLRHRAWERCRLRVHTVLQKAQDPGAVRRSLQAVLRDFRIDAEVSVVEAGDDADMYAYTHDWTMRKEQAEMFREALMEAQGGGQTSRNRNASAGEDESGLSALSTPPRSGSRSPKNGASTPPPRSGSPGLAESQLGGSAGPHAEPESPALALEPAAPSSKTLHRAFPSEIDMLVKDHGEVEDPELMDVRHLRRNSTRAGLDLHSDGTSPIDKGHASLASIFDLGDVATPAPASRRPRGRRWTPGWRVPCRWARSRPSADRARRACCSGAGAARPSARGPPPRRGP